MAQNGRILLSARVILWTQIFDQRVPDVLNARVLHHVVPGRHHRRSEKLDGRADLQVHFGGRHSRRGALVQNTVGLREIDKVVVNEGLKRSPAAFLWPFSQVLRLPPPFHL